jgi:hypothetical protein
MNREGAETFLRLLAETEIRGPMTPALRMPWSGDAPAGSTSKLMVTAAKALAAVQALDSETAEQILTDFDLAAIVRPGHPQPEPAAPVRAPRPRPGQLRFTIPSRYGIPPAGETAPSAPPRPGWMERFVPVGVSVPFSDDEFTGELQLLSYAHVASGAVFAMSWSIRHSAAPYTAIRAHPRLLTWRFTITDDRGQHYELDAAGEAAPVSADVAWLRPDPPPDIRWLEFSAPGTSPVRVELAATAGAEAEVSEARLSAGEQLLIMIAERLMALAANFPQAQRARSRPAPASWPGPASQSALESRSALESPGALDATAAGLGTIIAALEAAEVLSPLSPVPGWLATLCASLNISEHGITVPPVRDLPEPWMSLLAHYQRRKPNIGPAHDDFAATTVALPELDGIRLVLLGLHTTDGVTSLHALASGLNPDARTGPCDIEMYFPLSVWIRDSGGRWHAVQSSGWHRAGPEYALQLRLVPPLPRSAAWIEVLAAGRSAQVRARLTLRWGDSP